MASAIRTAVLHERPASGRAGARVIADSAAAAGQAETQHKAHEVLSAIATAEGLREL